MRLIWAGLAACALLIAQNGGNPFAGRWDITVTAGATVYPDWMELVEKSSSASVRIQPRGGSVRPAQDVRLDGAHLLVTLNPGTVWDLTLDGGRLSGVQKRGDKVTAQLAGVRAQELKR